jgi:hypothetical protein
MAAGDYYIRVARYSGDTNYTLQISPTGVDNLLSVENNLGTLYSGSVYNRTGAISDANTTDTYRFTLGSTSTLAMNLTGLSADSDLRLIRDGNNNGVLDAGELLTASTFSGSASESLNLQGLGAGTYFAMVYQYTGSTSYNFSVAAYRPDDPLSL